MPIRPIVIVPTAALLLACGRSSEQSASKDSASLVATALERDTTTSARADASSLRNAPTCPRTGLWALCSIEKRLEQSGFVLRKAALPGPNRPGFSVTPTTYLLGSAKLEVFVYPDEKSLMRDWVRLDTLGASPRGTRTAWEATPTLVRSANLAALFLSESTVKAERLALAITAGPPQPGIRRSANQVRLPAVHIGAPAPKPTR